MKYNITTGTPTIPHRWQRRARRCSRSEVEIALII